MALLDFILTLVALLLWLSWQSLRFDPVARSSPVTLVGTLRPADPRRFQASRFVVGLVLFLSLRALLYWVIGSPAGWTPKLDLGVIVLAFRSDLFRPSFVFSWLSFIRLSTIFYFWLLVLALINRRTPEADPLNKLIRLHLGRLGRWPWPLQAGLPFVWVILLWLILHPLLMVIGTAAPAASVFRLLEQGALIAAGLLVSLKYLLPIFLCLYLVASYVYLGSHPLWDFISITAKNLLAPFRFLPLRFARLDLAPVAGVVLIFLFLHWLPNVLSVELAKRNLSLWPQ
jgi:uncharacterized protein YggT (Ycf19 family)